MYVRVWISAQRSMLHRNDSSAYEWLAIVHGERNWTTEERWVERNRLCGGGCSGKGGSGEVNWVKCYTHKNSELRARASSVIFWGQNQTGMSFPVWEGRIKYIKTIFRSYTLKICRRVE